MASYLFVDVDTLLTRLRQRGVSIDLYEFANKMRGGAALAAGLNNPSDLVAVAVAPWGRGEEDKPLPLGGEGKKINPCPLGGRKKINPRPLGGRKKINPCPLAERGRR